MRSTGRYSATLSDFDIDHEITKQCNKTTYLIKVIEAENSKEDAKAIKKAMIETLLNSI